MIYAIWKTDPVSAELQKQQKWISYSIGCSHYTHLQTLQSHDPHIHRNQLVPIAINTRAYSVIWWNARYKWTWNKRDSEGLYYSEWPLFNLARNLHTCIAPIVLISKRTRSSLTSSTFFRWYCKYNTLQEIHTHNRQQECPRTSCRREYS